MCAIQRPILTKTGKRKVWGEEKGEDGPGLPSEPSWVYV